MSIHSHVYPRVLLNTYARSLTRTQRQTRTPARTRTQTHTHRHTHVHVLPHLHALCLFLAFCLSHSRSLSLILSDSVSCCHIKRINGENNRTRNGQTKLSCYSLSTCTCIWRDLRVSSLRISCSALLTND